MKEKDERKRAYDGGLRVIIVFIMFCTLLRDERLLNNPKCKLFLNKFIDVFTTRYFDFINLLSVFNGHKIE